MEKEYEKKYHDVEAGNWWFKSRRNYILDLLKDAPRNSRILDIGCSSGMLLKDLEQIGFDSERLFGVDISTDAIDNCKKNGLHHTFVMDAQQIELTEKFDIIIASDCLEHLENDRKALKNWKTLLRENGKIYIFVPAFQSLWSNHDVINRHFRRYTKRELTQKIADENFQILTSGYWNFFIFVPAYIFRKIKNTIGTKDPDADEGDIVENKTANKILLKLLNFENKLQGKLTFPFGVSTFCIAKKSN